MHHPIHTLKGCPHFWGERSGLLKQKGFGVLKTLVIRNQKTPWRCHWSTQFSLGYQQVGACPWGKSREEQAPSWAGNWGPDGRLPSPMQTWSLPRTAERILQPTATMYKPHVSTDSINIVNSNFFPRKKNSIFFKRNSIWINPIIRISSFLHVDINYLTVRGVPRVPWFRDGQV